MGHPVGAPLAVYGLRPYPFVPLQERTAKITTFPLSQSKNAKIFVFYPIFHLLTPFFAYENVFLDLFPPRLSSAPTRFATHGAPAGTTAPGAGAQVDARILSGFSFDGAAYVLLGSHQQSNKLLGDETLSKMVTDYSYS